MTIIITFLILLSSVCISWASPYTQVLAWPSKVPVQVPAGVGLGTLTDTKVCTYTAATNIISCDSSAGAGSVTTVSVVSANGLAGTVANASSTPAITLSTTVTGVLKGDGTTISAASAGTDYLTPTGSIAGLTGTISPTVLGNSTMYVGTTAEALNRASGSQALTGISSIDGSAATLTTARAINGQNFNGSAAITVPVNNTDDHTTNATMYPIWSTTQGGNYTAYTSSNLTWNPSTATWGSSLNFGGNPTTTTQAATDNSTRIATTAYVTTGISNAIAGVNPAVAVQAATTAASDTSGFTYTHVAGIGDFFTGSVNTAITIDGYTFTALGQRLLVKNDTQNPSGAFNGVYYVTQVQTAILAPILTRALDYDQSSDINNTGSIPVVNGTANASTSWVETATVNTVGTDPLTFVKFSINPTTILTTTGSVTGATSQSQIFTNGITVSASNIVTDTTTGTKIGTATGQKLGFFNASPVAQQGATIDLGVALSNLGLRAVGTAYPITTSGTVNLGLTASQILADDGSSNIISLTTATYPSLTELSYVKGVTSAIQTQLNTIPAAANPTATVTITATNGGASTFMRSDAAPALGVVFGAWTSVNPDQVYQAATDRTVYCNLETDAGTVDIQFKTDGSNPPTTIRARQTTATGKYGSVGVNVRKNDYFNCTSVAGTESNSAVYVLPTGS